MKVTRKVMFETNVMGPYEICIGDQIAVKLCGFGEFTATAQKVTKKGILFLFDDAIANRPMNESGTNAGGFEQSDMKRWLRNTILPAFPEKLRCKVTDITLPTMGEIFGHDYFYENFEPDKDEQFELMKRRDNRACIFNDDWCWWWLRNTMKQDISSVYFAAVSTYGDSLFQPSLNPNGVRPEFWLGR